MSETTLNSSASIGGREDRWCSEFGRKHGGSSMASRLAVGITLTALFVAIASLLLAAILVPHKVSLAITIDLFLLGVTVLTDILIACLYLKPRYVMLMLSIGISVLVSFGLLLFLIF